MIGSSPEELFLSSYTIYSCPPSFEKPAPKRYNNGACKGRNYYLIVRISPCVSEGDGMSEEKKESLSIDEELVLLIRSAGYYLYKNIGRGCMEDAGELFALLDEKEKIRLSKTMRKCIKTWKV